MMKDCLDDEGSHFGVFFGAFLVHFCLVHFFIRVENGLTELGWILGRVQMNARIKAHLIITFSGRSESYNKKCTKSAPRCTNNAPR